VKDRGLALRDLIGGSWPRFASLLLDAAIALAFLLFASLILELIVWLLRISPTAGLRNVIPSTSVEIAVYLVTALSAAFCEELVFRGYLQWQLRSWTQSAAAAVVLQGISFGLVHGYQGGKYMVVIAVFGSLFGLLAIWRQSLRPGMIAHFVQDGVGGLIARHLLR
jgi:membrane protease YdiL (CAAX protease family)